MRSTISALPGAQLQLMMKLRRRHPILQANGALLRTSTKTLTGTVEDERVAAGDVGDQRLQSPESTRQAHARFRGEKILRGLLRSTGAHCDALLRPPPDDAHSSTASEPVAAAGAAMIDEEPDTAEGFRDSVAEASDSDAAALPPETGSADAVAIQPFVAATQTHRANGS